MKVQPSVNTAGLLVSTCVWTGGGDNELGPLWWPSKMTCDPLIRLSGRLGGEGGLQMRPPHSRQITTDGQLWGIWGSVSFQQNTSKLLTAVYLSVSVCIEDLGYLVWWSLFLVIFIWSHVLPCCHHGVRWRESCIWEASVHFLDE